MCTMQHFLGDFLLKRGNQEKKEKLEFRKQDFQFLSRKEKISNDSETFLGLQLCTGIANNHSKVGQIQWTQK